MPQGVAPLSYRKARMGGQCPARPEVWIVEPSRPDMRKKGGASWSFRLLRSDLRKGYSMNRESEGMKAMLNHTASRANR